MEKITPRKEEVLNYTEFRAIDSNMPYSAYLQGLVEDDTIPVHGAAILMASAVGEAFDILEQSIVDEDSKELVLDKFEELKRIVNGDG